MSMPWCLSAVGQDLNHNIFHVRNLFSSYVFPSKPSRFQRKKQEKPTPNQKYRCFQVIRESFSLLSSEFFSLASLAIKGAAWIMLTRNEPLSHDLQFAWSVRLFQSLSKRLISTKLLTVYMGVNENKVKKGIQAERVSLKSKLNYK